MALNSGFAGMSLALGCCARLFPEAGTGRLGLYTHGPGLEQDEGNGAVLLLWAGGCLEELLLSPWTSPENRNKETGDAHVTPSSFCPSQSLRSFDSLPEQFFCQIKTPSDFLRKIPSIHAVLHAKSFTYQKLRNGVL